MKKIFSTLRISFFELVFGRNIDDFVKIPKKIKKNRPKNVMVVDVKVLNKSSSTMLSEDDVIREIESQSGDKVIVLPIEDSLFVPFVKKFSNVVYKFVLRRLKMAISNNLNSIDLFQLKKSGNLARVSQHNYEKELNVMMNYFIKTEEYEYAGVCRDLIKKIKSNETVNKSN